MWQSYNCMSDLHNSFWKHLRVSSPTSFLCEPASWFMFVCLTHAPMNHPYICTYYIPNGFQAMNKWVSALCLCVKVWIERVFLFALEHVEARWKFFTYNIDLSYRVCSFAQSWTAQNSLEFWSKEVHDYIGIVQNIFFVSHICLHLKSNPACWRSAAYFYILML